MRIKRIDFDDVIFFIFAILATLAFCLIVSGCRSVKQYEYYKTGEIKKAFYTEEFAPNWSEKESIIKTGNIGITL
jgi:hypothetical protein